MKACVVIPVLNEQEQLVGSIERVHAAMRTCWPGDFTVVIADNGSTDNTGALAYELEKHLHGVEVLRLAQRGRGGALRAAWSNSDAEVLAYMDVDLSTDLAHLPDLLNAIALGQHDLAIGSRLLHGSKVTRSFKRELLSRGYNLLLRQALGICIYDAQCGFKAISKAASFRLLPLIKNNHWFFDTELLTNAEWEGLRIKQIPVTWVDDEGSSVKLLKTIHEDLCGIWRLWLQRRKATVIPTSPRVLLR